MKAIKLSSVKKKLIVATMIGVLILTAVFGFYFGVIKDKASLLFAPTHNNYVIDIENPIEVAGHVDFVFAGKVVKQNDVKYEGVFERETEEGLKTTGTPFTSYDVTVLKNLKGDLKTNETIPILKEGGISMDKQYLIIGKGDFLPEEGDICVFFVSVQKDGTLLLPGRNFNVKIMESKLTKNATQQKTPEQIQQIAQDELEAIEKSSVYQTMLKACENEVLFERERYTAPAEFLESSAP